MTEERAITGEVREYTASDGRILRYRHYEPSQSRRACVVALHGIQSHSGWYEWSSSRLADAGYDVRFLDRRGSGLNETDRGHATSAAMLLDDVRRLVVSVRDEFPADVPLVLTSVSWGGKLAAALAAESSMRQTCPIDGIALLYPAIFTKIEPNIWQRAGIRFAQAVGLGRRSVTIPLNDPALFTDDRRWQQYVREDPQALHRVSLSFLAATLELTQRATSLPDAKPPPMFIALAGRDEIVDLPPTRQWAATLPEATTRIVEYPHARHTLEFDSCRERFVADLVDWIESVRSMKAAVRP